MSFGDYFIFVFSSLFVAFGANELLVLLGLEVGIFVWVMGGCLFVWGRGLAVMVVTVCCRLEIRVLRYIAGRISRTISIIFDELSGRQLHCRHCGIHFR